MRHRRAASWKAWGVAILILMAICMGMTAVTLMATDNPIDTPTPTISR